VLVGLHGTDSVRQRMLFAQAVETAGYPITTKLWMT
jgi:hypothetical protein